MEMNEQMDFLTSHELGPHDDSRCFAHFAIHSSLLLILVDNGMKVGIVWQYPLNFIPGSAR